MTGKINTEDRLIEGVEHEADYSRQLSEARVLFDREAVRSLSQPSGTAVFITTAAVWIQLIAAWILVLRLPPAYSIAGFVMICACVSAMQLWVHESSHFSLFKSRKLNDLWSTFFFAAPIGMRVSRYRRNHITHHMRLGHPTDLDRFAFNVPVSGLRGLTRVLLRGLTGFDAFRIITGKYLRKRSADDDSGAALEVGAIGAWNLMLFALCALQGQWYAFFVFWVYPVIGVAVTINSIRSIAEHQPHGLVVSAGEDKALLAVTRTTIPIAFEKWLMYQSNFNLHFEHHLFPSIPARNLPIVHRRLVESGFYRRHPQLLQKSGFARFIELSRTGRNWNANLQY
jgi:fatty acid desaturase